MTADADLDDITPLALAAQAGDSRALEELCRRLQGPVYRLALRFAGQPADAEDLAQEVLIRLVTHLSSFEGRSRFTTWAYTVAARQMLRSVRRPAEASVVGPEAFGAFLDAHAGDPAFEPEEQALYDELCADVRLACTSGMLLALKREARVAYVLGDLIGLTAPDAAEVLGTSPAAFRQRLSRARSVMRTLMGQRCGLVRAENPCRCDRLVEVSEERGLLDRSCPVFARHPGVTLPLPVRTLEAAAQELDLGVAVGEVYRSDPSFLPPERLWGRLEAALPHLLGA